MATIDQAVFEALRDDTTLTTLLGGSGKVFNGIFPKNVQNPFVSFRMISYNRAESFAGPVGLANPRLQIDCWANKSSDMVAVAERIRTLLDGHTGALGVSAQVSVRTTRLTNQTDDPEDPTDASNPDINRRRMDFEFWIVES